MHNCWNDISYYVLKKPTGGLRDNPSKARVIFIIRVITYAVPPLHNIIVIIIVVLVMMIWMSHLVTKHKVVP